jgi:ferrous-iron efflux pump FieF
MSAAMTQPGQVGRLMRRAAMASVSVALVLVAIKAAAYFASHSVAMLAAMADSALDLFTSSINLLAIRQALIPADAGHRFGHGKAEPLAGLAQSAFIAASALFVVIQAAQSLAQPAPIEHSMAALAVMGISIVLTLVLVAYQRYVVRLTGSLAVEADGTHYASDLAINLGVVLALALDTWLNWTLADPLVALSVAAVMLWGAWRVGHTSLDQLMDHELPEAEREKIRAIVRTHGAVRSMHDLRTRAAGMSAFIQLHLEMDPDMRLVEAHAVSDAVERDILAAFPRAEIMIHQDPVGLETPPPEPPG